MRMNDYQRDANRLARYPGQFTPLGIFYATMKLTGEAGEFSEKIGKALRDDDMATLMEVLTPMDAPKEAQQVINAWLLRPLSEERRAAAIKELGDVLWYIAALARELDVTLEELAQANLDKLYGRRDRGTLHGDGDDR